VPELQVGDDRLFREQRTAQQEPGDCTVAGGACLSNARVASFFAGIGGFDRAFELEGARVVYQCEKDRFCRAVLKRHWPKAAIVADIRHIEASEIPDAEIWTAGFPCQDVSLARGNHGRTGLKGNHTSLFFKLADLVAERHPKVLLLENVVGLLNSHRGLDFAIILRELTSQGYAVAWRVMNARYFGAPQSRPRVFLCAWKGDYRKAVQTLFERTSGTKPGPERTGFVTECNHATTGAKVPLVAYCVSATSGRHTGLDWSRSYVSYADAVRRPTPTESERLQGFPAGWTIPAEDYRPPARGLDSERYRAVGNAVAIPVVHWIAKRLLPLLETTHKADERELPQGPLILAPDLKSGNATIRFDEIETELDEGHFQRRWKSGGCAFGNIIVEGSAPSAPTEIIKSSFVDALDESVPDDRYFLTPNAATGILRRADALGRNLFRPMRQALEILAKKATVPLSNGAPVTGETIGQSSIRTARPEQRRQVAGVSLKLLRVRIRTTLNSSAPKFPATSPRTPLYGCGWAATTTKGKPRSGRRASGRSADALRRSTSAVLNTGSSSPTS
jgi:DNA (cytosine-5)-methyltransferase 1